MANYNNKFSSNDCNDFSSNLCLLSLIVALVSICHHILYILSNLFTTLLIAEDFFIIFLNLCLVKQKSNFTIA